MKARSRNAPVRIAPSRPLSANGLSLPALVPAAAVWDSWLDGLGASPAEQFAKLHDLLNSAATSDGRLSESVREVLAGRGQLPVAPPVRECPKDASPAVAAAWSSPDICLWNRGQAQDVSALAAEFLRNAATFPSRVLVLAASPAPIERLLARLAADPKSVAIRFGGPGERSPSGPATRFSFEEQAGPLRSRLAGRIELARADGERRRARAQVEADVWNQFTEVIGELNAIDERRRELTARLEALAEEVRREAESLADDDRAAATGPFAADFAQQLRVHRDQLESIDRTLAPLREQEIALEKALAELAGERATIEGFLASYRAGRWWTPAYWRGYFASGLRRHAEGLVEQDRGLRQDRERILADIAAASANRIALSRDRAAAAAASVDAEIDRRRAEISQMIDALTARRGPLLQRWQSLRDRLPHGESPAEPSVENLNLALQAWRERGRSDAKTLDVDPASVADAFVERLANVAPVLAGTTLALARQPIFAAAAEGPFDLLILDDADRLAEGDLLALLARAPRALLIGSATSTASPFGKLWRLLHRSEPPSAYRWSRSDRGYVCTLRPVAPADEAFVEIEHLADFPEIELRILSAPKSPPRLAQVAFPSSLSARDAKAFIYRELQEASVDRVDRPAKMFDSPDRYIISWQCPESPAQDVVELEPGLREAICVHDDELTTCRLEFDKSAGWSQPKIHDWLRRHLLTLDAPRTADVER